MLTFDFTQIGGAVKRIGYFLLLFYSNGSPSPKKSWFQISVKAVEPFGRMMKTFPEEITYFTIAYRPILLCKLMVTIIFINIFQTIKQIHFSAVKFSMGTEKNTSFLLIPKSNLNKV